MVDGGFDPLHHGHIEYFRCAKELGVAVLCNVTGDNYISEKHPVVLSSEKRAAVIDAVRYIEYTHPSQTETVSVLEQLRPKYYVKGNDWKGKLPTKELDVCRKYGIEVVYVDSVLDSSTNLISNLGVQCTAKNLAVFEHMVIDQRQTDSDQYDQEYFTSNWREIGNSYTVEARRKIEGRNPALIKDIFSPKKVADMGCGPGALMYLLRELGVEVFGVDYSAESKQLAPDEIQNRITIGSVTNVLLPDREYDLVICREVFEHLTVLQIQQAVQNICRISSKYVYVTTRFHPKPTSLFDVTNEFHVDPTHITCLNQDMLRLMFVLQGMKRRADLEIQMDWLNKKRVLVYEKIA
jgi:cytidyltransferase-like protein